MHARDLLASNESAIAVFTRGDYLKINPDKTGYSGIWKINPDNVFQKVIIYLRDEMNDDAANEIFVANLTGIHPSEEAGRYYLDPAQITFKGNTFSNWKEFSEGGQNPVKYINPQ